MTSDVVVCDFDWLMWSLDVAFNLCDNTVVINAYLFFILLIII